MFSAASLALSQMFSPPFRSVLLRSIGFALVMLLVFAIGLNRLFGWLAGVGETYLDPLVGPGLQGPLHVLIWVLAVTAGLGLFAGAVFIMPAVTSFVASFFSDEIGEEVERVHYPADPPGVAVPLPRAVVEGVKTGLLALLVYMCALPLVLFAGLGFVIFFIANAYLLSREYFLLAAMRFHSPEEARALRRLHHATIFTAGLFIAAFVSIPILNFATPVFAMAFMTHLHKRIVGPQRELITHT